jgi:putative membrane protein
MGYYHPFFFPFGFLFGLLAILMIFGALRWLLAPWGYGHRRRYWRYRDQSYYILRERYAKGEITKEKYEQMMQDLQKQPSA